jgi:hypothetical protein
MTRSDVQLDFEKDAKIIGGMVEVVGASRLDCTHKNRSQTAATSSGISVSKS